MFYDLLVDLVDRPAPIADCACQRGEWLVAQSVCRKRLSKRAARGLEQPDLLVGHASEDLLGVCRGPLDRLRQPDGVDRRCRAQQSEGDEQIDVAA